MECLLLDERPTQATVAGDTGDTPIPRTSATEAPGSEQAAWKAGSLLVQPARLGGAIGAAETEPEARG